MKKASEGSPPFKSRFSQGHQPSPAKDNEVVDPFFCTPPPLSTIKSGYIDLTFNHINLYGKKYLVSFGYILNYISIQEANMKDKERLLTLFSAPPPFINHKIWLYRLNI